MKRFCLLFTAFCLLLGLTACGLLPSEEKPSISVADPTATMPTHVYESDDPTEAPTEETADPMAELYVPGNSFAHVYRTENGSIWATVIMEFTNIDDMPLRFDNADIELQGRDGEIFQTLEDVAFAPQVIAPGETGYYCETVELDTAEEIPLTPKLSEDFRGVHSIYLVEGAPTAFEVSEPRITDSLYGGLVLQATITNNTGVDGGLVCVTAILKNDSSEPVGFITGCLDGALAASTSAEISFESFMLPPELTTDSVAEIELFAYPISDIAEAQ